ncbi:MAG: cyclic nucleotide-binding domain-containing protein [Legionella sp.]
MNIDDITVFSELFQNINTQDLKIILKFCKSIRLQNSQYLFYDDVQGDSVYLIKSGKIAIEAKGQHLSYLYSGDFFGEMSILDRKPRSSSVFAETITQLYALNMLELHAQHPEI